MKDVITADETESVRVLLARLEPVWIRLQTEGGFSVERGSAIYYDDEELRGLYQMEHLVDRTIRTSIGHWRAIQQALIEDGRTWIYSYYPIARAAVENAAAAYWLLEPERRRDRQLRLLMANWDNHDEARKAFQVVGELDGVKECRTKQTQIVELASANGTPFPKSYRGTSYLELVQSVPNTPGSSSIELLWRMTSGMSHGKWWAFEELSSVGPVAYGDHGNRTAKFSFDIDKFRTTVGIGTDVLLRAVELYDQRRTAPFEVVDSI